MLFRSLELHRKRVPFFHFDNPLDRRRGLVPEVKDTADIVPAAIDLVCADMLRVISPSALESYARCPFAYFINYALRPTERRVFEMGARDIGEMYHNAIMESSERLTDEGIAITDKYSSWMTVERNVLWPSQARSWTAIPTSSAYQTAFSIKL